MSDRDHEFLDAVAASTPFGAGLLRAAPGPCERDRAADAIGASMVLLSFESALVPPSAAEVERELGLPEGAVDRNMGVIGDGEDAWSYSVRVRASALRDRDLHDLRRASERIRELRIGTR